MKSLVPRLHLILVSQYLCLDTGCLGFSIGSCSVSVHSGSCAGSHITSAGHSSSTVEQGSSLGHWFIGNGKLAEALRQHLVEELNLNAAYTNHSATGLHFAWGCYLGCTATLARAKEMVEAGNWPSDIPVLNGWSLRSLLGGQLGMPTMLQPLEQFQMEKLLFLK